MPVDMSIPNSIIAAYLQGVKLRQEREENANLNAYRAQQLQQAHEQFQEQIKVRREQITSQAELNQSLIRSRLAQQKSDLLKAAGLGYVAEEETDDPMVNRIPGTLFNAEDLLVPSPAARAARKLEIGRADVTLAGEKAGAVAGATQQYKKDLEELRSKLVGGRQEAQLKGQIENALKLQQVRTADAKDLLELKRKGQLELEHIRGGYRIQAAGMRSTKEGEEISEEVIKKAAEHAATGVVNTTDLPKVVGGIKNVPKVYAELSKSMLAPLNQKQIDNLEALKMVNRVGSIFKAMNDIIQAKGRGAFTTSEYAALKDELQQVAPLVRGLVKNAGAFSNQDADRAEKGAPSLNDGPFNTFSKTASQHKTDSFLQLVNDRRKSIMGKLSIRHQRLLEKAYDLSPDPDLEEVK